MGRVRTHNLDLPRSVYLRHGSYYLVKDGKWIRLNSAKEGLRLTQIEKLKARVDSPMLLSEHLRNKYGQIKSGAKERGLEFDVSKEFLVALGEKQGWRCAMSDIHLSLDRDSRLRILPYSPSIDRIDHGVGYIEGNVRVVCAALNIARSNLPDDIFLHLIAMTGEKMGRSFRCPKQN